MRDRGELSKEIEAKYACSHTDKALRNKPDKNGVPRVAYQCLKCGRRVGQAQRAKDRTPSELINLPKWDGEHENNYLKRKFADEASLWQVELDKDSEERQKAYEAYLKTPKWQALRRKVMARAENVCEGCRTNRATQVHHLHYTRLGDEMLFDLVAVCDDCHAKIHKKVDPQLGGSVGASEGDVYEDDDGENFPSGGDDSPF